MCTPSITVRDAGADDLDHIESLLDDADLPSRDVRSKVECFSVAIDDGAFVGCGGLEVRGRDALLRSVAVVDSRRGRGYGTALCDELETRARAAGVERLYLLTTTAAAFFRNRGYEKTERAEVPTAVRETAEFTELCPASAVCLWKPL